MPINIIIAGIGMMPKRGCDVATCEIAKFYRLNNSGLCQVGLRVFLNDVFLTVCISLGTFYLVLFLALIYSV